MTDLASVGVAPVAGVATIDADDREVLTPLDFWLADQQHLTAVDRFTQHHDSADAGAAPLHATVWTDLVPLTKPRPGEQYRFEVDLDACTGCKACVAACHSLNGLDDGESFRSVGTLHGFDPTSNLALVQTVTTACHHCVEPACMIGCPTKAYEKDPVTGIVRHLDDQCIGCSYCTLTCPYEVPKFNERLGIVRKCDLCQDRLAEGEAPACVQACPTSAIKVGIANVTDIVAAVESAIHDTTLVPSAPSSTLSTPTTRYHRSTPLPPDPIMVPADRNIAHPAHAHTPLAVMLVLTQLAVGIAIAGVVLPPSPANAIATLLAGALAISASLFHLGRPMLAWKAVLGLRTSWLSREILVFAAFSVLASLWSIGALLDPAGAGLAVRVLGPATAATGVIGVVCSALIYVVTGRRWWSWWRTLPRFLSTVAILGCLASVPLGGAGANRVPAAIALAVLVVKLSAELLLVVRRHDASGQLRRTARLLRRELTYAWRGRLGFAAASTFLTLTIAGSVGDAKAPRLALTILDVLALFTATASELFERWLFFRASSPRRMPGTVP